MADIFESNVQSESALEVLVGEGKKFADAESLARAKIEADRTVADRNRELEEHRQEIARLREEVLAVRSAPLREPAPAPEPPKEADRPVEEAPNLDLASRVREELTRAQQEDIERQNVRQVQAVLLSTYGTLEKAREVVNAKADELGLSVDFLNSVALKSPKAFLAQIGLTEGSTPTSVATRGDVNTTLIATQSSAPKQGTYPHYEQMRKDDPKRYWTAEVQNQMFADRKRLGEQFYPK